MKQHDQFLCQNSKPVGLVAADVNEDCEGGMDLDLCDEQELAKVEAALDAVRGLKK